VGEAGKGQGARHRRQGDTNKYEVGRQEQEGQGEELTASGQIEDNMWDGVRD
jgi:hypothetical protein